MAEIVTTLSVSDRASLFLEAVQDFFSCHSIVAEEPKSEDLCEVVPGEIIGSEMRMTLRPTIKFALWFADVVKTHAQP